MYKHTRIYIKFITYMALVTQKSQTLKPPIPMNMKMIEPFSFI